MRKEVSITEAAHVHGVSTRTIERWRDEGSIEAYRVKGRRWVYVVDVPDEHDMPDMSEATAIVPYGPPSPTPAQLIACLPTRSDLSEVTDRLEALAASVESLTKEQSEALASERQKVIQLEHEAENLRAALKAELARPWYKKIFRR